jgi:choloylglycine hydrolase
MTNLNNYVNLYPGSAPSQNLHGMHLAPFSYGSGMLGLPGDFTPPSRFVRAAFFQSSAPQQPNAEATVRQCFQILNAFDIPIGVEFGLDEVPVDDMLSATQWTSATDMKHCKIYFRTMYTPTIRYIDLNTIDFRKVKYHAEHFDTIKQQPIEQLFVN